MLSGPVDLSILTLARLDVSSFMVVNEMLHFLFCYFRFDCLPCCSFLRFPPTMLMLVLSWVKSKVPHYQVHTLSIPSQISYLCISKGRLKSVSFTSFIVFTKYTQFLLNIGLLRFTGSIFLHFASNSLSCGNGYNSSPSCTLLAQKYGNFLFLWIIQIHGNDFCVTIITRNQRQQVRFIIPLFMAVHFITLAT